MASADRVSIWKSSDTTREPISSVPLMGRSPITRMVWSQGGSAIAIRGSRGRGRASAWAVLNWGDKSLRDFTADVDDVVAQHDGGGYVGSVGTALKFFDQRGHQIRSLSMGDAYGHVRIVGATQFGLVVAVSYVGKETSRGGPEGLLLVTTSGSVIRQLYSPARNENAPLSPVALAPDGRVAFASAAVASACVADQVLHVVRLADGRDEVVNASIGGSSSSASGLAWGGEQLYVLARPADLCSSTLRSLYRSTATGLQLIRRNVVDFSADAHGEVAVLIGGSSGGLEPVVGAELPVAIIRGSGADQLKMTATALSFR